MAFFGRLMVPRLPLLLSALAAGCASPATEHWPPAVCGALRPAPPTATPRGLRTRNQILLALDGVRWQEIFQGVDPDLAHRHGLSPDEIVDGRHLLPHIHRY